MEKLPALFIAEMKAGRVQQESSVWGKAVYVYRSILKKAPLFSFLFSDWVMMRYPTLIMLRNSQSCGERVDVS